MKGLTCSYIYPGQHGVLPSTKSNRSTTPSAYPEATATIASKSSWEYAETGYLVLIGNSLDNSV